MKLFVKFFIKVFLYKSFQTLSLILTSIPHENTIEILLFSKKRHLHAKFFQVDAWSQALLFREETIFLFGYSLRFTRVPRMYKN